MNLSPTFPHCAEPGREVLARKSVPAWLSLALLLVTFLALPQSSRAQKSGDVILDGNEQLFDVLAALNASGYDTGMTLDTGNNTRQLVRDFLAKKKIPVLPEIRRFYIGHKILDDPGADLGQYVSLALLLGPAPDFKPTVAKADLPPDAKDVSDLIPLLKTFYQQADLGDLWTRVQTRYQAEIVRYDDPVRSSVQLSDAYLRFPSGAYLGRTYSIFLDLLGAPNQVQARIYGMNYFLVITPSKQTKLNEIRYQYLHFLLDPLAVKYAPEINEKAELRPAVRKAPMLGTDYKEDFPLLLTECLIRSAELHMDRQPKDAAEKSLQELTGSGLILAPYFYSALAEYNKQDTSISVYYKSMIQGIDVDEETAKAAKIKFTEPPVAAESKKLPAQSEEEQLLNTADNALYLSHYDEAKTSYQSVLEKLNPKSERALYGMAAVYTYTRKPDLAEENFKKALDIAHDLRIATWCHIYLGRIYDLKGKREDALAQYRAASLTAAAFPLAERAVQAGMAEAFGTKKSNP